MFRCHLVHWVESQESTATSLQHWDCCASAAAVFYSPEGSVVPSCAPGQFIFMTTAVAFKCKKASSLLLVFHFFATIFLMWTLLPHELNSTFISFSFRRATFRFYVCGIFLSKNRDIGIASLAFPHCNVNLVWKFSVLVTWLTLFLKQVWKAEQSCLLLQSAGQPLSLAGDGRCDSPCFSAKYMTYTLSDATRDVILHTELVQVCLIS